MFALIAIEAKLDKQLKLWFQLFKDVCTFSFYKQLREPYTVAVLSIKLERVLSHIYAPFVLLKHKTWKVKVKCICRCT